MLDIKSDFPALQQKIRGRDLIYLDSAATSLKPQLVIDRITKFNTFEVSNVHRGAHYLSDRATELYEQARSRVAQFIGAEHVKEIVFTRGTTEGINLVAHCFGQTLRAGDEIIISEMEHHSNIVPWQLLAEKKGLVIRVIPITDKGELDYKIFENLLNHRTQLVSVVHCSNHLGTINDIRRIAEKTHQAGAVLVVDGAQYAGKFQLNVKDLNADFYTFSGHNMFAPFGVGVVYGKESLLKNLPPYQSGGSMIAHVSFAGTTFQDPPFRFEAGTPNVEGAVGLAAAIDYIESIGLEKIEEHEKQLSSYTESQLKNIEGLTILGQPSQRAALFSFIMKSIHHSDLGQVLDQQGIAIRSGHHCTQPLLHRLGIPGSARASISIYNNKTDIDRLIAGIKKAQEILL
jgi:cysteine desulfurase/selenocysteine lyase